MSYQQSFSWWCYENRGVDGLDLIEHAARTGYKGVEFIPADLRDAAVDHGLAIATHIGSEQALNDAKCHAQFERDLDASLELASKYSIPNLIVFSGNRIDQSEEQAIDNMAHALSKAARSAENADVNLAIELLNSKVDHHGYQCDNTPFGLRVCELVNSPRVKLLYDIYHMQIMEGDIIRTIESHHASFCHYHTAGVPGRGEIGSTQELYYPSIFKAIDRTGYGGYIGHEFLPSGDPRDALKAAFELAASH